MISCAWIDSDSATVSVRQLVAVACTTSQTWVSLVSPSHSPVTYVFWISNCSVRASADAGKAGNSSARISKANRKFRFIKSPSYFHNYNTTKPNYQ